jgi:FkbM family methyltransferase
MPPKTGSYQTSLPYHKDALDYWLTRFPRLYLLVEQYREWENWDKRVYLSFIQSGNTILDIGANVGAHTIAFSRLVGKEGTVLAFEPVPANFDRLRETVRRRSRAANIRLFQLAVGDPGFPNEPALIKVPGDDFSQASLMAHSAESWEGEPDVRTFACAITSLDAELAVNPVSRVDFIKIDVEGGELNVLKGAVETLSKYRPLLYCEMYEKWTASFGYASADIFAFARSLGYSGARVIREGEVHAIQLGDRLPEGLFDKSSDVLFFAGKHHQSVARFDRRYDVKGADEPKHG